ncbi:hypothetical protein TIFTF001_000850 [Ficus carica]|uniref:Uncharacterized protein n=1 Tax=Ficus carica TaxID=3494 RepID=A0AA88CQ44_FICCA|nr:hypothetical protein TIFTF001_000850 [Ficus carica]
MNPNPRILGNREFGRETEDQETGETFVEMKKHIGFNYIGGEDGLSLVEIVLTRIASVART